MSKASEKRSGKRFPRLLAYLIAVIIAGLIGLAIAGNKYFKTERTERSAVMLLEFLYDGAARHKTPDGGNFSIDEIRNEEILNAALAACGMSDRYSAEQIAPAIQVRGSYPRDILRKIKSYHSLFDFTESRGITVKEYFPTAYSLKLFDSFDTGISDSELSSLCEAIAVVYRDYFVDAYVYTVADAKREIDDDIGSYDFSQQVQVYENILLTLEGFAKEMYSVDTAYTYQGSSFNDIYQKLNLLRTSNLNNVSAVITMNAVTTSASRLKSQYQYEIQLLQNELEAAQTNLAEFDALIDSYETDDVMYIGTGDSVMRIDSNSAATYEELQGRKKELTDRIAEINYEINHYSEMLNDLETAVSTGGNAAKKDVESKLADIAEKIDVYSEEMQAMVADYNGTLISTDDISIRKQKLQKPELISGGFIAEAIKCAGPLCIVVMIVCCVLSIADERKKYRREKQEQIKS